jgi:hypothetical protein
VRSRFTTKNRLNAGTISEIFIALAGEEEKVCKRREGGPTRVALREFQESLAGRIEG